ncbi:MAG: hypothetical protein U5M50_00490 [Sphingobium sp.]|nr:hypothetical protein [Sphingobium sp.]
MAEVHGLIAFANAQSNDGRGDRSAGNGLRAVVVVVFTVVACEKSVTSAAGIWLLTLVAWCNFHHCVVARLQVPMKA